MKSKYLIAAVGLGAATSITLAAAGVVNADSSTATANVGSSGIPRSVFRQDKLEAVSQVLNTSESNIQTAIKDKTLKSLISDAGLTGKTFSQKVRAQLTTDLENSGYTQDQVTIALQHREIVRLRHKK